MYETNRLVGVDKSWWNPDRVLHREIDRFLPTGPVARVLDYGAGNSPYRNRISCEAYVTADITQNIRGDIDHIIRPGNRLELPDA